MKNRELNLRERGLLQKQFAAFFSIIVFYWTVSIWMLNKSHVKDGEMATLIASITLVTFVSLIISIIRVLNSDIKRAKWATALVILLPIFSVYSWGYLGISSNPIVIMIIFAIFSSSALIFASIMPIFTKLKNVVRENSDLKKSIGRGLIMEVIILILMMILPIFVN